MIFEQCENKEYMNQIEENDSNSENSYKILALGDSYTIGERVCETCKFPEQLKKSLSISPSIKKDLNLTIIAKTGWTTTNLLEAISTEKPANHYNLITLLIGVNNQYQKLPFSVYETEFPKLVDLAISKGKNDKKNVIIISIPDYAFTPFGKGNETITNDINKYNAFAENYCKIKNISFVNITDITQMGLQNPELVASDGLHPSKSAYSKFVERLLPIAIEKLN